MRQVQVAMDLRATDASPRPMRVQLGLPHATLELGGTHVRQVNGPSDRPRMGHAERPPSPSAPEPKRHDIIASDRRPLMRPRWPLTALLALDSDPLRGAAAHGS